MTQPHRLVDKVHHRIFSLLYQRSLVFNTCWEDPAVDRLALDLRPSDRILVITSAGCNALDYALAGPASIHAVDANPRQTALLELKIAGIRSLSHDDFFDLFGEGRHPRFRELYRTGLRSHLSPFARDYWDHRGHWFEGNGWRNRFYWRGLTGLFARLLNTYFQTRPTLRRSLLELLDARDLAEQGRIFQERVEPRLWNRAVDWTLRRPLTMTLLGIPYTQRREIEAHFHGDLAAFIRSIIRHQFMHVPLESNYFWTLYMRGHYTPDCCPEYLKPEGFHALQAGLVDRIHPQTCTVTELLRTAPGPFSRFVLLDHMDWMSHVECDALAEEWEWILASATPDARVIFRSGALHPTFLDELQVQRGHGGKAYLRDLVVFDRARARELEVHDRVGTYASFHIVDLKAA